MAQQRTAIEAEISELIAARWSPRTFDQHRPVESDKLLACLEAARWSSSCFGDQPWRFIVADRSANPDGWQQMLSILAAKNQLWAKHAPVLILACAADHFSHNGNPNRWAQYDTGQAMMSLSLQAVAEGLVTHPMGGFDPGTAASAFNIPENFTPMSVTAMGYAGDIATLDEGFHGAEQDKRTRKPITEITYTTWNQPWEA